MPKEETPDISNVSSRAPENVLLRPISNCYVFAKVMQDYPDICRRLAACILGEDIGRIEMHEAESVENTVLARGVRFDVYLRGTDALVAMEMQASCEPDLPLRNAYYQSWLTRRALDKGKDFSDMPRRYVVFICTYDPLGCGRSIYRVARRARDERDDECPWEDREESVLLNATAYPICSSPEVAAVLKYVYTGENDRKSKLVADMDDARIGVHRDEEWVSDMNLAELDKRAWEKAAREKGLVEGLAEGREKGLAEGLAEGREEGLAEGRAAEIKRQAMLLDAMRKSGREIDDFTAAIMHDDLDALYREYDIG